MTTPPPGQLTLDLPHRPALGRDDFLVSPSNNEAVEWVDRWPEWPGGILALSGPPACGKSHLIEVWRARSAGPVIPASALSDEDWMASGDCIAVDNLSSGFTEDALFHAINWVRARGATMLLAGDTPPSAWSVALRDLKSRLLTIPVAEIDAPDDALLRALIVKQFSDRQIAITPDVVDFVGLRIERSFAAVRRIVDLLDARALAEKRALTIPFVRRVLREADQAD